MPSTKNESNFLGSAVVETPSATRRIDSAEWSSLDLAMIAAIVLLVVMLNGIKWDGLPAEDALMLMRYATHFVEGHGIVWNVGDPPVEGATDFLYLIALSGWMKVTHFGAIWAARTLLAIAHLAETVLLYTVVRRVVGTGRLLASSLAIYLALGPGIIHVSNGFSSPFYGFLALCAWSFAFSSVLKGTTWWRSLGFAFFALLTGLTRPDGVFLALFMTCALLYALRRASVQIVFTTVLIFVVLGGAYFAWRFHYFGHLLPNPFYKKGGGHFYPSSLKASVSNTLKLLIPFVPLFAIGLALPGTRRVTIFSLIPIGGFALIWGLLTNENNSGMRFQYVLLPVGLLCVALIVQSVHTQMVEGGWPVGRFSVPRWSMVAILLAVSVSSYLWWKTLFNEPELIGTGPYEIAVGLSKYEDRHYTLVATEAGVIPYFSHWRTIDSWGLNDVEIAHNPRGLTTEYLDRNHPAIIMMHASAWLGQNNFDRAWRGDAPPTENVDHLVEEASHYAQTHGYVLAARWGMVPCTVHIWYLRKDLPEFDEMLRIIRKEPHFYPYNDAGLATNFLEADPPSSCDDSKSVVRLKD